MRDLWLLPAACALSGVLWAAPAWAQANQCDPLDYGAVGDGTTDNTAAIQLAIDNCASIGGGIVPLSNGTYLTAPIVLRSHILLQINQGATLLGTTDQSKYVIAFLDYPYRAGEALVSANGATDVGIIGGGTIDGQGGVWWPAALAAKAAGTPYPGYPDIPTTNGLPRPWLVEFYQSSNVTVSGIHLRNSPMWNLGLRFVTGASVSNLTVTNPSTSPNTDGTDIAYSSNITMTNLLYDTGDDNVAIKSGLPSVPPTSNYYATTGGPLAPTPTTNVTIANSTFLNGHGLSVGSEAVNGVQNVRAFNITFNGTQNGFRIKTGRDRGNNIGVISLTNLKMTNVGTPLSLSAYYPSIPAAGTDPAQPVTATTPFVHDITVSNLTATGATTGGLIVGLPESPILGVTLRNVSIQASKTGMELRNVTGTFSGVTITPAKGGAFVTEEHVAIAGGPSSP